MARLERLRRALRDRGVSRRRLAVAAHRLANWSSSRKWLEGTRFFLGTGMGRSGTNFLSRLLDRAAGARVCHEPVGDDVSAYRSGFCSSRARRRYVENFRLPEIDLRLGDQPPRVYGEVNSHLRRHIDSIRELLPDCTVFHLVRHGGDVVRSMYARDTFRRGDRVTDGLRPCPDDPFRERWRELSRFERLCWYWARENTFVRRRSRRTIRFERLLESYEYFRSELLELLQVDIERGVWEHEVNRPRNTTTSHTLEPFEEWGDSRKEIFWEICGEEMQKCGYETP